MKPQINNLHDDQSLAPMMNHDSSLKLNELLIAEFEYLAQAAQQANEDRARVTQYYFMALGSLVASLLSLKEIPDMYIETAYIGLCVIFAIFAGFGVLTIEQLIRLRISWVNCSFALDKIKDFYIKNFSDIDFSAVILFRTDKLPSAFKPFSISHLLSIATSLMSTLSVVVAIGFWQLYRFKCIKFDGTMILGAIAPLLIEQFYYCWRLVRFDKKRNAEIKNAPKTKDKEG